MLCRRLLRLSVGVIIMSKNSLDTKDHQVVFWSIIVPLSILLFGMLLAMLSVMLYPDMEPILMKITGIDYKPEIIKLIGWGMGGIIATLGVVGLLQRATAQDKDNKIAGKGHIHERLKAAIDHLGNKESVSTRIASFNEFYRLAEITAKITEEKGLKETVFDILCSHLRYTTKHEDYKKNLEPTEEVQSLLDVLFKPKNKGILIFRGLEANLAEVHLQGAHLRGAHLQEAKMQGVNLRNANLRAANLQGAHLQIPYMKEGDLEGRDMQKADLLGADLLGAEINERTLLPDSWATVVQQYNIEGGKKGPGVKIMDDKGKF